MSAVPWKNNLAPAVTLLFKSVSTDLHVGWTLADYSFLYVG